MTTSSKTIIHSLIWNFASSLEFFSIFLETIISNLFRHILIFSGKKWVPHQSLWWLPRHLCFSEWHQHKSSHRNRRIWRSWWRCWDVSRRWKRGWWWSLVVGRYGNMCRGHVTKEEIWYMYKVEFHFSGQRTYVSYVGSTMRLYDDDG